jgi:hypothetical protein
MRDKKSFFLSFIITEEMMSMEVLLEFKPSYGVSISMVLTSYVAPSSLPEAYKTLSKSLHWVMYNFFPMTLSQSLASKGSTE